LNMALLQSPKYKILKIWRIRVVAAGKNVKTAAIATAVNP
jgi:hypothetical protein